MQKKFEISELSLGAGTLGICPLPGHLGPYEQDLETIRVWAPALVISMTDQKEMFDVGADEFGTDLRSANIEWHHLPTPDYGALDRDTQAQWPDLSAHIHTLLNSGNRILVHCKGGCGRSGMILLRLMIEAAEPAQQALIRLRQTRPCAVETNAQRLWAENI